MSVPDVAYSLPADFTRPITPALLALYGDMPALPCSGISNEVLCESMYCHNANKKVNETSSKHGNVIIRG